MIKTEIIDGLYHTYSDAGVYIHGGDPEADYAEAYDPVERVYTETDKPIPETDDGTDFYTEAGKILLGEVISDD